MYNPKVSKFLVKGKKGDIHQLHHASTILHVSFSTISNRSFGTQMLVEHRGFLNGYRSDIFIYNKIEGYQEIKILSSICQNLRKRRTNSLLISDPSYYSNEQSLNWESKICSVTYQIPPHH